MVGWWWAPARPSSSRKSRPRTQASISVRSSPKADRMRMQDGRGGMGTRGGMGRTGLAAVVFVLYALPAYPAQVTFEQAAKDLSSSDPGTRVKAAQMLK